MGTDFYHKSYSKQILVRNGQALILIALTGKYNKSLDLCLFSISFHLILELEVKIIRNTYASNTYTFIFNMQKVE